MSPCEIISAKVFTAIPAKAFTVIPAKVFTVIPAKAGIHVQAV
jgi:hypothetical protein